VANQHVDAELIERAKALPPEDTQVKADSGQPLVVWVPAREEFVEALQAAPEEYALRETAAGEVQVLLRLDKYNVTGDYLTNAKPGESFGRPVVNFSFNSRGAALLGRRTGENLPDTATGRDRLLAIVLDGVIASAPILKSTITDRGIITGDFTTDEVHNLVGILNAGALPAPLKLVRERAVDNK
jgi:preprotein translocase subunit SecD